MYLEDMTRKYLRMASWQDERAEDREIYAAVARMFDTLAEDIIAEYREAEGRKAIVWESVIRDLGIRL